MNAPIRSVQDLINGSTALTSISAAFPRDFVDTVAGSGKTVHGRGRAIRLAQDREKVFFVQPTNKLNGETYLNLTTQAPDVRVTMLNTTTHAGRVVGEIERHLLNAVAGGEIVLITHEAFDLVRHW